jgi:sugar lactone lactonase YvrE
VSKVQQITDPIFQTAEGPVWFDGWGGLRWVDLPAGDVVRFDAGGNPERWHVGSIAAAIRPRDRGGVLLALERSFAFAGGWGSPVEEFDVLWTADDLRFNEGGCAPDGTFYCGSTATDFRAGPAAMYALSPDGSIRPVLDGLGVSNGIDWSPDGRRAYYADTLTGRIDVFDWDAENGLQNRRPLVEIPAADGRPDGLTVDSDGYIWTGMYLGSAVRRFTPDGRLDDVLPVPVRGVTSCAFGGPGLGTLYITTTRGDGDPAEAATAGALFQADLGVTGRPIRTFPG